MPIGIVTKQANVRQPIISHRTTGLNATRNPSAPLAMHVRAPLARLKTSNQPVTAVPGIVVGKRSSQ